MPGLFAQSEIPHMPPREQPSSDYIRQITAHQPMLYGYVLSLCPDRTAARDILQETNLVLWEKSANFTSGTSFKAWAFRIAYFQTLAHLKRVKRSKVTAFEPVLLEVLAGEAAEQMADFDERHAALRTCLAKLPPQDLHIVKSHYEGGMQLAEIGTSLDRTAGALKQVLRRVRHTLKICIERRLSEA